MNETPFRIALVVVIVLTMVVTVYHRLQAAKSGEKISHKDEGYVFATVLRLAGLVLWISTFGYLLFPAYFQRASLPLPRWLRWTGVISGDLCSLLMYWTLSSLGKNLTDTVVTRAEATLVTNGPYRWVRHPAALLMALRDHVDRPLADWCRQLVGPGFPCCSHAERGADVDRAVGSAVPGLHGDDGEVLSKAGLNGRFDGSSRNDYF